jgi:predicted amidohydrolase YtcJ
MAAELVIEGRIATLRGDAGPGWVESIAIRGGRVVASGTVADVGAAAGTGARRLRLGPDEVALPGLTDAHLHLATAALAATRVDLEGSSSIDALVGSVAARVAGAPEPTGWILGQGWSPDRLGRWPTADDLEAVAPSRRVALWAHDHHSLLVSRRVLADAGIDEATPDPPGGVLLRDPDGRPTGVLQERAAGLAASLVPVDDAPAIAAAVRCYARHLLALGVVAVHDPGPLHAPPGLGPAMEAYASLATAGALDLRLHACLRESQLDAAAASGLRSGGPLGPDPLHRLRVGWLKLFADGSLGSRTAALLDPLEPGVAPGGHGVRTTSPTALAALVRRAADQGLATMIHAIGDAAVRGALTALGEGREAGRLLPRIEHVQLLHPDDAPRFRALGVAASVQPVHVRNDVDAAREAWGDRADLRGYPYALLDRAGALLCFGSDAPVEAPDPWPGIAIAVTRRSGDWPTGTRPLGPEQGIGLWRALRAATVDPALVAGETDRGRLVPGARADLVVVPSAAVVEPVEPGGALERCRPRLVLVDGAIVAGTAS